MSGMKSYGLDLEDMVVSALENDAKIVGDMVGGIIIFSMVIASFIMFV